MPINRISRPASARAGRLVGLSVAAGLTLLAGACAPGGAESTLDPQVPQCSSPFRWWACWTCRVIFAVRARSSDCTVSNKAGSMSGSCAPGCSAPL